MATSKVRSSRSKVSKKKAKVTRVLAKGAGATRAAARPASSPPAAHVRAPCAPAEAFPKLGKLIDYLQNLQGRADLATLSKLLGELRITREDIVPACQFGVKGYRRNVIAASEHFELLALTWRSGHCTPIHDHRGVSCAFRVVEGTGTEVRFVHTPCGLACPTGSALMHPGYVCAADEPDIHQVANHQAPGEDLITLHIYSPRITKMNVYKFYASEGAEDCDAYKKAGRPGRGEGLGRGEVMMREGGVDC